MLGRLVPLAVLAFALVAFTTAGRGAAANPKLIATVGTVGAERRLRDGRGHAVEPGRAGRARERHRPEWKSAFRPARRRTRARAELHVEPERLVLVHAERELQRHRLVHLQGHERERGI